jgi:hypothetical protein
VGQLSPEQQETLASIELKRAQKRQRLVDRVGGSPASRSLPSLFAPLVMILFVVCVCLTGENGLLTIGRYAPIYILLIAMIPCFFVQVQVAINGQRMDALVELLEADRKESGQDA